MDDVVNMLHPNDFMATVDIASAYRSISVHTNHWTYQGVSWLIEDELCYMQDTRICFGLKLEPFLFTHISNFIVRCMARRGYDRVINYLDDFIVIGDSFDQCQEVQQELIQLLGSLGFRVSWKKCSTPSTLTRYLGIIFDSESMKLSLPTDKLEKLHSELNFFKDLTRATKRQLQRLCGILSHCAKMVKGARTFSRRVIDLLKGLGDGNPRIYLSKGFKDDLTWWQKFASTFNGTIFSISYNYGDGICIYTDSSLSGYVFTCELDWQAGFFATDGSPNLTQDLNYHHCHWLNYPCSSGNINELEMIPVWLALQRYAAQGKNTHTDNNQVLSNINTGVSVNINKMILLREIFWLCVSHNLFVTARRISSVDNVVADKLSRLSLEDRINTLSVFCLCCS